MTENIVSDILMQSMLLTSPVPNWSCWSQCWISCQYQCPAHPLYRLPFPNKSSPTNQRRFSVAVAACIAISLSPMPMLSPISRLLMLVQPPRRCRSSLRRREYFVNKEIEEKDKQTMNKGVTGIAKNKVNREPKRITS